MKKLKRYFYTFCEIFYWIYSRPKKLWIFLKFFYKVNGFRNLRRVLIKILFKLFYYTIISTCFVYYMFKIMIYLEDTYDYYAISPVTWCTVFFIYYAQIYWILRRTFFNTKQLSWYQDYFMSEEHRLRKIEYLINKNDSYIEDGDYKFVANELYFKCEAERLKFIGNNKPERWELHYKLKWDYFRKVNKVSGLFYWSTMYDFSEASFFMTLVFFFYFCHTKYDMEEIFYHDDDESFQILGFWWL